MANNTIPVNHQSSREGLTSAKFVRFISLPFKPRVLKTYLAVKRFEDIPIDRLLNDGVEGVLLDADGTMGTHHARRYPQSVVDHVFRMADKGLKAAIYTNSDTQRFQQFQGIEVVREAYAKPDPRGFTTAMKKRLGLGDPSKVCMIGDNFITDGGAVAAGMRFIYVQPIEGSEGFAHAFTRYLGVLCARFYHGDLFTNS